MESFFTRECGLKIHTERDHLIIEPDELKKESDGGIYQVYSPFARRWMELFKQDKFKSRVAHQKGGLDYLSKQAAGKGPAPMFSATWQTLFHGKQPLSDCLIKYAEDNGKKLSIELPKSGSVAALKRLQKFSAAAIDDYAEQRDFPAVDGTSQLSIFFKNGSLTTSQVLCEADLAPNDFKSKDGPNVFLKEIIWREFYYHILFHRPDVERQSFLEKFRSIEWEDRSDWFDAWKKGETGYPIIDAGMRQLNETGWMHNRVRMIVASFLTKDLHINWQWGERYFMEKLLDGDLAPNNGGWQWAASTGCDPQPYFRIFNPYLQSKRFDVEGNYIRKYVPELRDLQSGEIHEPWESGKTLKYPRPIVDHDEQKMGALELYKAL